MITRRAFLADGLRHSTLVALAPTVPAFLARSARAVEADDAGRVLVLLELAGGNDGINTVVPFRDEGYARSRPTLRLTAEGLLKLDDRVGLNPALRGMAELWEAGVLAIVQGVGYPNPNRSHFESRAIWHTARPGPDARSALGWIGRGLDDAKTPTDGGAAALFVGDGPPPVALRGRRSVAACLDRPEELRLTARPVAPADPAGPGTDLAAFARRSLLEAYATADRLDDLMHEPVPGGGAYPATDLGRRLRTIAGLIRGGLGARAYFTQQDGYDTHALQRATHDGLLRDLADALLAFHRDLAADGLADRVLVLGFSEFGRRVAENLGRGTDHGTAGPVFLAGPGVRPGLVGATPSLTDLEDGDLKWSIDFRRIYATLLEGWLGLPAGPALGGRFEPLPLLQA